MKSISTHIENILDRFELNLFTCLFYPCDFRRHLKNDIDNFYNEIVLDLEDEIKDFLV